MLDIIKLVEKFSLTFQIGFRLQDIALIVMAQLWHASPFEITNLEHVDQIPLIQPLSKEKCIIPNSREIYGNAFMRLLLLERITPTLPPKQDISIVPLSLLK